MLVIKQVSSPLLRLVRITLALWNGHKYKIINILRLLVEPGLYSLPYTPGVEPLLVHFIMTGLCAGYPQATPTRVDYGMKGGGVFGLMSARCQLASAL